MPSTDFELVEVWLSNDHGTMRERYTESTIALESALKPFSGEIIDHSTAGEPTVRISKAGKSWLETNGYGFLEHLGGGRLAVFDGGSVSTVEVADHEIKVGLTA